MTPHHTITPPQAMTNAPTKEKARSLDAAYSTADQIKELHDAWRIAGQEKSEEIEEDARQLPASVNVRSCWVEVGSKMDAFEYRIEMSGGGPAVSIFGTIDNLGYPIEPEIKHQDWFTPWEYSYNKTSQEEYATEAIEWFVSLFNFEV